MTSLCACTSRCGDDGDTNGPGTCKGLPLLPQPLVEIVLVPRQAVPVPQPNGEEEMNTKLFDALDMPSEFRSIQDAYWSARREWERLEDAYGTVIADLISHRSAASSLLGEPGEETPDA